MFSINPYIISMLGKKIGCDITQPHGASLLRNDIESKTGEYLSLNTIKRLVGIIPYDFNPRPVVLEILARYLDFSSWKILNDYVNNHISEFTSEPSLIDLTSLKEGKEVSIEWEPDRKILIRHLGGGEYHVVSAENSKLKANDVLIISAAGEGFPFVAKSVIREGKNLGSYTASAERGISLMKIL